MFVLVVEGSFALPVPGSMCFGFFKGSKALGVWQCF